MKAEACNARREACDRARREAAERERARAEAEHIEQTRHHDAAAQLLADEFGCGRKAGFQVEHVREGYWRKRSYRETIRERAYQFTIDGLSVRITEAQRTEHDGSMTRIGRCEYDYTVYVLLPGKPRFLRRPKDHWYRVRNQADLGRLLIEKGLCE
jgi:hypothetical protein